MRYVKKYKFTQVVLLCISVLILAFCFGIRARAKPTSYAPVAITEEFESVMGRMKAALAKLAKS